MPYRVSAGGFCQVDRACIKANWEGQNWYVVRRNPKIEAVVVPRSRKTRDAGAPAVWAVAAERDRDLGHTHSSTLLGGSQQVSSREAVGEVRENYDFVDDLRSPALKRP